MGDFIFSHPFIGVTITGCIVFSAAMTLLICLLIRGWRTKTMRGYFLVYLLLFNMALVWACQIPLNWVELYSYGPCPDSEGGTC